MGTPLSRLLLSPLETCHIVAMSKDFFGTHELFLLETMTRARRDTTDYTTGATNTILSESARLMVRSTEPLPSNLTSCIANHGGPMSRRKLEVLASLSIRPSSNTSTKLIGKKYMKADVESCNLMANKVALIFMYATSTPQRLTIGRPPETSSPQTWRHHLKPLASCSEILISSTTPRTDGTLALAHSLETKTKSRTSNLRASCSPLITFVNYSRRLPLFSH